MIDALTSLQRVALITLRTLIGWHFLYEGYYKLVSLSGGGWDRAGAPLGHWSAAGYLKAASGPLAPLVRPLADSSWLGTIDWIVAAGLFLCGLGLLLGLFTQASCIGALALLTLFYLSAIPTAGVPQPFTEGAYLLVNKNLVEWGGLLAVFAFRTGRIAGLDLLWPSRKPGAPLVQEAV